MLWIAITHKRTSFVKAIISRGASLRSLLTEETFEKILNGTDKETYFYGMLSKDGDVDYFTYDHFQEVT